jgi:nitrite reductase (NADH) small subunit/3-phenylpropionate/trans-cinnamate dioxygenase ferredoxin subunit
MLDFRVKIASVGDVPTGEGRVFEVKGRMLAVFNVDGQFYATDNECPHRGGPLGEGELDGTVVRCPWHAWRWDVSTGANVNNPAVTIACFPVTIQDGAILVDVGSTPS